MNAADKAGAAARKREHMLRLEHESEFTPLHMNELDWRDCPTCITQQELAQIKQWQAPPIPITVSRGIGRRKLLRSLQPMWPFMPEVPKSEVVAAVKQHRSFLHQLDEPQYDFIGESRRQRRRRTLNTGMS